MATSNNVFSKRSFTDNLSFKFFFLLTAFSCLLSDETKAAYAWVCNKGDTNIIYAELLTTQNWLALDRGEFRHFLTLKPGDCTHNGALDTIAIAIFQRDKRGVFGNVKYNLSGGSNLGSYDWAPKIFCITPNRADTITGSLKQVLREITPPCAPGKVAALVSFGAMPRDQTANIYIRPSKNHLVTPWGKIHNKSKEIQKKECKGCLEKAKRYQRRCNSGERNSCRSLSRMYANGQGVKKDEKRSLQLSDLSRYIYSCNVLSVAGACVIAGKYYDKEKQKNSMKIVKNNNSKAFELYGRACDGGDVEGCNLVGEFYFRGDRVKQDYVKAARFYNKACFSKFPYFMKEYAMSACHSLADLYRLGKGVPKNVKKANVYYKKACKSGVSKKSCSFVKDGF